MKTLQLPSLGLLGLVAFLAACGTFSSHSTVVVDGSSTVYPITEAVVEEFRATAPDVRVTIGISGTGGGFKKFVRGEVDISNASRPIQPSEQTLAEQSKIDFIELPVAYDGITVVVHPDNDWVDDLTVGELKRIWEPAAKGKITRWSQIRAEWPNLPLNLFGPGIDSGTYDYFTQAICGESGASRGDFTSSEDDNVLVQGVAGDRNALGFFGFAYFEANRDRLRAVPISATRHAPAVLPTPQTIANQSYDPLSRPVFIYIKADSAARSEVQRLVEFYLTTGPELIRKTGFIPLAPESYRESLQRFRRRTLGTAYSATGTRSQQTTRLPTGH